MPTIRALRRSRGMTFSELALASGVSVRTLAEIEYGLQVMDARTRRALAEIFGLAPDTLRATAAVRPVARDQQQIVALGIATLAGAFSLMPLVQGGQPLLGDLLQQLLSAPAASQAGSARPQLAGAAASSTTTPSASPTATATPEPTPTATVLAPTPTPSFRMTGDGPRGCPVVALPGQRIVITQPYGVGTHAPGLVWGGVDLAIDGDGDGNPEPGTTQGVAVLATHGGTVQVFPESWPGGNFVIISQAESRFGSAYGHLDSIALVDGQAVEAGASVGTIGTTGMSSGPHLHYEVRTPAGNIDPAPLIDCE
ncbi:MAG: peptidoglycan DD-metalloendopeptidase family protein [Roseiflexaceae bacterium]|nr:peptidoglycan DD-metalloendopeptidase family protein [Roseiflexaceae bacterium]